MKKNNIVRFTDPSDKSLNIYIKEMQKFPPLSANAEREMAIQAHEGDEMARHLLIMHNLRAAYSIAKEWSSDTLPLRDLMGAAIEGLINGIDNYNPYRENRLLTYLWWKISEQVQAYSEAMRSCMTLSHRQCNALTHLRNARQHLEQEMGCSLDNNTLACLLADEIGKDSEEILEVMNIERSCSLDHAILKNDSDDDEEATTIADFISDYDDVEQCHIQKEQMELLMKGLYSLPECSQKVLTQLFGFDGEPMKVKDIADELHCTPETVRNYKVKGLAQLRSLIESFGQQRAA